MKHLRTTAAALLLALLLTLLPLALAEAADFAPLAPGDTGDAVVAIQEKLIEKGYLEGEATGVLDDATAEALTQFQADADLTADGAATVETQEALFDDAAAELTIENAPFIGNSNTKKFHKAACGSVKEMKDGNKVPLADREDAIEQGFDPCKRCKP